MIFKKITFPPLSLSRVFPVGLFRLGKVGTPVVDVARRNSIDKRDHRKLFHATLSANACTTTSAIRARACWRETPWRWVRSKNTTALWHGAPRPVSLALVYIDEEAVASAINAPFPPFFLPFSTLFHRSLLTIDLSRDSLPILSPPPLFLFLFSFLLRSRNELFQVIPS